MRWHDWPVFFTVTGALKALLAALVGLLAIADGAAAATAGSAAAPCVALEIWPVNPRLTSIGGESIEFHPPRDKTNGQSETRNQTNRAEAAGLALP